MCRSTDYHGFQPRRDRLKIRAFFLRFSGLNTRAPLPESLTLSFLPRINENELEIDGSKIRPDAPAFLTLCRVMKGGEVIFGSRERVEAGDGIRFEVYLREEKVLKGTFRKDEGQEWKLECKCALESESESVATETEIAEAQVCVAVEGHLAMIERVRMVVKKTKKHLNCGLKRLEEIPEEGEVDYESDGRCCNSAVGGDLDGEDEELEVDMEGVRWAVDVGIWVMCLGVCYFVSKASAKTQRRRRLF